MVAPAPETFPADESVGLIAHFSALLSAKLAYLRARLTLAGMEGKEAAVHYALILAFAIIALVLVIFGYFFLVIALVFLVSLAFGGGNAWIWVMFGAALLHLAGAFGLLLAARARLAAPMLSATFEEFRKDQEWLRTSKKAH